MPSEPPKTRQDSERDLKTFDELPAKTKKLVVLKDRAEKATGRKRTAINRTIVEKAR